MRLAPQWAGASVDVFLFGGKTTRIDGVSLMADGAVTLLFTGRDGGAGADGGPSGGDLGA
jgi:hypothetical protein